MFKQLLNWSRSRSSKSNRTVAASPRFEALEDRQLMTAAVASVVADNRGLVSLAITEDLRAKTVTNKTVKILTAGRDGKLGTADDANKKAKVRYSAETDTITAFTKLPADTRYRVVLVGNKIKSAVDGRSLDGEFNRANRVSGNGTPGGNYDFTTKAVNKSPVAYFSTSEGVMEVTLFKNQVAITVNNFITNANNGLWDKTFFHRTTRMNTAGIAVIQGGGYFITNNNTIDRIVQRQAPIILQDILSNVRGTISMARTSDPNSGTVEWFFNYLDNTTLDGSASQDGYAVFGQVSAATLATMDAIAAKPVVSAVGDLHIDPRDNAGQPIRYDTAFGTLPVNDAAAFNARTVGGVPRFEPATDAIRINRVAIKMAVSKTR